MYYPASKLLMPPSTVSACRFSPKTMDLKLYPGDRSQRLVPLTLCHMLLLCKAQSSACSQNATFPSPNTILLPSVSWLPLYLFQPSPYPYNIVHYQVLLNPREHLSLFISTTVIERLLVRLACSFFGSPTITLEKLNGKKLFILV